MSLLNWHNAGWIRPHQSSPEEIRDLLRIADRDLSDATSGSISADSRYCIAYDAALKLCTILLLAEGYRPEKGQSSHKRAIDALPLILGADREDDARYLDLCRGKRNAAAYDYAGGASDQNADDLIAFARELRSDVRAWLQTQHPDLSRLASR
ncbi:MAG: hypothetical protein JWM32_2741 [Verrucomicrobia bacterium]|nr:hypothetical protein [Verrucomicrobiota bacterium]